MPARMANERFSRVGMRDCRTTTSPATTPKATCEAMNQGQSMWLASNGFSRPSIVYSSPDHRHRGDQSSKHDRPAREHGKHRAVEQSDEGGDEDMQTQSNREAVRMKRIQLCGTELQRFGVDDCGKKIDRIPDAAGLQHTVGTGQHRHRYALPPIRPSRPPISGRCGREARRD